MIRVLMAGISLFAMIAATGAAFAAGAIAVNDSRGTSAGNVGYAVGSGSSKEAAARDALVRCRKAGNSSCEVVAKYHHCGAYAASRKYASGATGNDEAIAKRNALKECGDSHCKIVVSDCAR